MFAPFMLHAWIVATLVAISAGSVGFFVVARRASFAAHALPLGAFPGAAAASLLGVNELWGLAGFAVLGVLAIDQLQRAGRREVASALWLTGALALGMLLLSLSGRYAESVYGLLFGNLLGIDAAELALVGGCSVVMLVLLAVIARPLLLDSLSRELAAAAGARPSVLELLFLGVLGIAAAIAVPVVGALLVFSLMVGPGSAARAFTNHPWSALALTVGISLLTIWSAIALAYVSNWPVGFFVGVAGILCYVVGRWRGGAAALAHSL